MSIEQYPKNQEPSIDALIGKERLKNDIWLQLQDVIEKQGKVDYVGDDVSWANWLDEHNNPVSLIAMLGQSDLEKPLAPRYWLKVTDSSSKETILNYCMDSTTEAIQFCDDDGILSDRDYDELPDLATIASVLASARRHKPTTEDGAFLQIVSREDVDWWKAYERFHPFDEDTPLQTLAVKAIATLNRVKSKLPFQRSHEKES